MAKNHYTQGITQVDKDTFVVDGMTVRRRYPRSEGVVGGATQVYEDAVKGGVVGYTLADVKTVAAARNKTKKAKKAATPEPALMKALGTLVPDYGAATRRADTFDSSIDVILGSFQGFVCPCPCCGQHAVLSTYDYTTFRIHCTSLVCGVKIERSTVRRVIEGRLVNELGPLACIKLLIAAWKKRPQ